MAGSTTRRRIVRETGATVGVVAESPRLRTALIQLVVLIAVAVAVVVAAIVMPTHREPGDSPAPKHQDLSATFATPAVNTSSKTARSGPVDAMLDAALENGGRDNVTLIVVQIAARGDSSSTNG